jgi:hypothetical protein
MAMKMQWNNFKMLKEKCKIRMGHFSKIFLKIRGKFKIFIIIKVENLISSKTIVLE